MQKFLNISSYWRIFNNFRFYRDFTLWSEWLFFHYVHLLFPFFKKTFISLSSFDLFPFFIWTPISLFFFGLLFPSSLSFFFSLFFFGHFSSLFFLDFYSIAVTFWFSSKFFLRSYFVPSICKTTFSVHWRVLIFRNWFYSRSVFTNSKLNMEKTNFEQHDFQNIVVYVINGSWANIIWKLYLLLPKINLHFFFFENGIDNVNTYMTHTYLAFTKL